MSSTPATPGASGAGTTATTVTVEPTAFTVAIAARTPIAVPAEQAWAVLTDFARYSEWNPFVTRIEGSLAVGEHLDVELSLPGRKPVRMKPRVVAADPGRSFAWLGQAWVAALADLGVAGAEVHAGALQCGRFGKQVCFAGIGPGEVTIDGVKVVGLSQRRTRAGARFQCVVHRSWTPEPYAAIAGVEPDELPPVAIVGALSPAIESALLTHLD